MSLLGEKERTVMDVYTQRKVEESKDRILDKCDDVYVVRERAREVIF